MCFVWRETSERTFDPLSANFFHPDQPELNDVEVVYWFSLASHPVIMDANMKYVLPSLIIAGASTRLPPSSFHPKTLPVGVR
jgi:hypothetical protein